ncbi:hypothetical protein SPRG_05386 [Saprolegnia parasitica CBS 223.65]|uniref:Telomeric single stranded DNA binding POT1/Cdc13 domain-containing protein n=1 Tax=Saprolegnia parasitica (strain CBS 223.65) TaxID=695850 RepID=A0A067CF77_SAPPC|nr:hypothetical protein SPRG_05386 [Saprolegnia parasitica CBS 223.65]KDO29143.1 hypothetical protein SPRG_05386 [Saprolegnia parasitica CBS 223.65]|eukprot:XP_012200023.1 hypothetical protein SPRG_05386 [Saprolegnia parasitica CBS 223.65]
MGVDAWLQETVVLCVWPRRSLPLSDATFDIGGGPCASVASRVVTMEVEELHPPLAEVPPRRSLVYLYDDWADKVASFLKKGHVETESMASTASQATDFSCVVVASPTLLEAAGLFIHDDSSDNDDDDDAPRTIFLRYQEPIRAPNSDQVAYERLCTLRADTRPPPPSKKRRLRVGDEYQYTPLASLGERTADVYGVVVSYTTPKQSSRGRMDFEMTIAITDESRPERAQALYINVFARDLAHLPRILAVGDVVRFHKLLMSRYNGVLVALCTRASRFVVFRMADGSDTDVVMTHTYETVTYHPSDKARAIALLQWGAATLLNDHTQCPRNHFGPPRALRHCYPAAYVDVIAYVESPFRAGHPAVAVVSDRMHVTAEVHVHAHFAALDAMGWAAAAVGRWCRFRGVEVTATDSLVLHFRVSSSLEIYPTPATPPRPLPLDRIVTRVPREIAALGCVNLAVFLTRPVPCKAHVLAEIVDVSPRTAGAFTTRMNNRDVYMGLLRLQDATASVDAILFGADGELFFGRPARHGDDTEAADAQLTHLRTHRQPLQWCLVSYRTTTGDVRVRIVQTQLGS